MSRELYFLRSSEQKIVKDMTKFAYPHVESDLSVYYNFYGLTSNDLGLYALVDNEIAGAIWTRELDGNTTPTMSFALLPKFKKQGIGIFMMEQFLQEAGAIYEEIKIDISHKPKAIKFYEKFGFKENSKNIMSKKLEKKEVFRPTDGYDPTHWMD
jgi:GNAT superfamily N-acetyltransferase